MMWTLDVRYAVRLLRQNWAFSLVVIAIWGLCIGVNAAVLSVVDAVLLRPLPYADPGRLLHLVTMVPNDPSPFETAVDGTSWQLVRDRVPALQVAVYGAGSSGGVNMVVKDAGVFVRQGRVSTGFFGVLGVQPFLGREFTAAEDRADGPNAVILSYRAWRKYFDGDPLVLGRSVLLLGAPYTLVGVMPDRFKWGGDADLWTSLHPSTTGEGRGTNYGVIARLRPGATLQEAEAQLKQVTEENRGRSPAFGPNAQERFGLIPLQKAITADLQQPLQILWIAVSSIFLLGCVNIGGMLLSRTSGRTREFSTRLALGATPSRIIQQLLLESLILGLVGGIVGLGIGYGGLAAFKGLSQDAFPFLKYVGLDWKVIAATFSLALVGAFAFCSLPAWHASRLDPRLAQTGSRTIAGRHRHLPLSLMVSSQVALATALLVPAVLLLRTFLFLWNIPAGFDPREVVTARFSLQDARYTTTERVNLLFDTVTQRLREVPGIQSAAVALNLPYERTLNSGFSLPGQTEPQVTNETYVTPEYFATLRVPFLQGRMFTHADGLRAPPVAIVNQAFAARYFEHGGALGAKISLGGVDTQIIGIVANVAGGDPGWGNFGPLSDYPIVFIPAAQMDSESLRVVHTWFSPSWIVRSSLSFHEVSIRLADAIRSADPLLPTPEIHSFNDLKIAALDQQRLLAALVNVLAGMAMALVALGIYGLIANLVSERTRELGIRIALGSSTAQALWTTLKPGLRWVACGTAAGGFLAISLEKLVHSFLWGVRPGDPFSIILVGIGLFAVTAIASVIPAIRILKIQPADTLRAE